MRRIKRQHQRRRAVIRHHQHVAVGAAAHSAGHAFALARRGKSIRPLDRLAIAHHCRETLGERLALRAGLQAETLGEARRGQRLGRLRQMFQQQLTARDGIRVSRFLQL